jgi:nitroreductase
MTEPEADSGLGLVEALETTRSIRRYHLDEDIPESHIARMLFLATRAPNPGNLQKWRFVVLRRDAVAVRKLLGDAYRDGWSEQRETYGFNRLAAGDNSTRGRLARAMDEFVADFERIPLLILACAADADSSYLQGAPIILPACQNLLLGARSLGYGGVLTTWHRRVEQPLRATLNIPDGALIAAVITLGRPRGHFGPIRRKPLSGFVYDGSWGASAAWADEPTPPLA